MIQIIVYCLMSAGALFSSYLFGVHLTSIKYRAKIRELKEERDYLEERVEQRSNTIKIQDKWVKGYVENIKKHAEDIKELNRQITKRDLIIAQLTIKEYDLCRK